MIGQTISHYKIIDKVGEGGMGIVYKAQDLNLDRFVALKFLPERLSNSEQDRARFLQEAKAASALNHPNICTIHGIEEHDKQMFIVMELVEGQTLNEKKSSISFKQAIDIGIQLAEGLAVAHEKGIVHRDIKPDNIMIRKDGIAQIMDFGLAKLRGVSRLTKEGSTVGTAGYMSPEQVQGQDADHRSDIFSLGVLLYELFTGQLPFRGVHETALMYEIVNVDPPPMSSIKPDIDPSLDAIILECMEKDPNERTQSVKQIAIDLKRFKRESSRTHMSMVRPALKSVEKASGKTYFNSERILWLGALILCLIGLIFFFKSKNTTAPLLVSNLNINAITQPGQRILRSEFANVTISPDGQYVAFTLTESGASQIYLRPVNTFESIPVKGTLNASAPFFSPDGQWIGFHADGKIKKVPTASGAVETVCDAPGFRGASWSPDNRIYYSPAFASGIMSVSASGGDERIFSTVDSSKKERTHRWPQVLPNGKWVLYTVGDITNPNSYSDASLVMQSVETGERRILDVRGGMARYVEPGYLVVARNGALWAAPFNWKEFRTSQPLTMFVKDVNGDLASGVFDFSISNDGNLVYLPGAMNKDLELVWVTRDGKITPLALPPQPYNTPRISPDGTKLAVSIGLVAGSDNDVWIYDLRSGSFNRLTFDKKAFDPIWSNDSKKIFYSNSALDEGRIMEHPADGSSPGTTRSTAKTPLFPIAFSADGKHLIVNTIGGPTDGDIFTLDLSQDKESKPLLNSKAYEYGGHISPNGRYIVYGSNESGGMEIYVRTFPDLNGKWQISTNGGARPFWSPDGKEVLYMNTTGKMMSVPVKSDPVFSMEKPRELFDVTQMYFPNNPLNNYDISPDGKRFIMVRNYAVSANVTYFNVIINWIEELRRTLTR
ncbi:serine/threonine-protein kinase [bacterium]|nr:serine/threonine-protein kinase [bacterium]